MPPDEKTDTDDNKIFPLLKQPFAASPALQFQIKNRLDRLSAYVLNPEPSQDVTPFWFCKSQSVDYTYIKKLLRISDDPNISAPELTSNDVTKICQGLTLQFPHIGRKWISQICHMLSHCETVQHQLVWFARSLHGIFADELATLDGCYKFVSSQFTGDMFEAGMRFLDLEEKTTIIIENEQRINHVASLCQEVHLLVNTEGLLESISRIKKFDALRQRIAVLEYRIVAVISGVIDFESRLDSAIQRIAEVNRAFTRVKAIKATL